MSLAVLTTATVAAECLALTLTLPRRGMVPAHLELSADAAPLVGEAATITLASETGAAQTFTGIIRRAAPWAGRSRVVFVLGAGKLRDTLPSRDHVGGALPVTALLVAAGIADASGETLSPLSVDLLASLTLSRWVRAGADAAGEGGTAIEALDTLCSRLALVAGQPELTWRILPDGTLWIGVDAFAEGGDTGNVFDDDPDDGAIICAPPAATLRPGTTINGRLAERVTYRIEGGALRAEVLYTVAGDMSANETPDVYRESHAATVEAQNADGTIDVTPDDSRLAGNGLRMIPFRVGMPGCKVEIPAGSRLRIAFADADPSQPFAYAIDQDTEAAHKFALVGDAVSIGWLTGVAGIVPVTFALSPVLLPPPAIALAGTITGPGHKFALGVRGPAS